MSSRPTIRHAICAVLLLAMCGPVEGQDRRERKRREEMRELDEKLARRKATTSGEMNRFLNDRAAVAIERARAAMGNEYLFSRLHEAADELLEASERIAEAATAEEAPNGKNKSETARHLEERYFRVQQADYFASRSGQKDAAEYVTRARTLYQQARSAYDAGAYRKADLLGEAADGVVDALECLAQAEIRNPEPPRL